MMERNAIRKPVQLSLNTAGIGEDGDSDSDSLASESTIVSEYDPEKVYEVEEILAEKERRGDSCLYLIKWAGYGESAYSWEPEENILAKSIITNWKVTLAQQKAGKLEPFDVAALELRKEKRKARREEKRRRKARKSSSGPARAPRKDALTNEDSDDQPLVPFRKPKKTTRSVHTSDEDDLFVSFARESSTEKQAKRKKKMMIAHDDEDGTVSDNSHMAELSEARRQARVNPKRVGKENTKISQEKQTQSEGRRTLQRSTDSPNTGSPVLRSREFPPPSRTISRDSVQETTRPPFTNVGNQGATPAPAPEKRPRGRPPGSGRGGATRGSTRGRGRSGALPATSHVFSRSEVPKMRKGSLMNALGILAPDAEPINQLKLSKNLSHARKLETAGRAKADRAPDLAVIGGLFNPAEIAGSRAYPILKPNDFRQPDNQSRQPSSIDAVPTSAPPSRRSSTNRVRFLDIEDSDDGPRAIFEEPDSIVENQGNKGQNIRDSPPKGQMIEHGIDQPDAPGQTKNGTVSIKPKPIIRMPTTSSHATPNEWAFQQPLIPRSETIPNTPTTHVAFAQADVSSNPPESFHPALDRKTSTGERKKVSLSEYNAKQRIEKGGYLVKQARFGTLDANQTLIAFNGVSRNSPESWVKEISSLDVINFVHICSASDFQAQPAFVRARVLVHGSIASNSEATVSLDRLSEHLRLRLGGLVFSHYSTAILIFPTRLEEWKFLENTEVPNTVALRYHIFKLPEFCPTISPIQTGVVSPEVLPGPPYWSSAMEFLCALSYESLLAWVHPSKLESTVQKQKQPDRDNFYLLIPGDATPSLRFLTTWLKSCKPSCKVLTNQKPGSWSAFLTHAKTHGACGTVLIHESLISQIPKLPQLQRLFSSRCSFAFFSISSCPVLQPGLSFGDSLSRATVKTRLFPLGATFFLAPSLLIADPKNVFHFLSWFRNRQEVQSTPGTYKLLGCHRMREFILDVANGKAAERRELLTQAGGEDVEQEAINRGLSYSHTTIRFDIYRLIDEIIETAKANLLPYDDLEELDEAESPIIYAPEYMAPNDEPSLLSWYAGWALLNVDKYNKFWIIGTDPTNIHKAVRMSSASATEMPMSEVADLVKVPSSSALENSVRWKKTGFTAVTEVTPAPLFSTVATIPQSNIRDDAVSPLTRSPEVHQATEELAPDEPQSQAYEDVSEMMELEKKIADFMATTGSTEKQAIDYLSDVEANLEAAVEWYWEKSGAVQQPVPTQRALSNPVPSNEISPMDGTRDASGPSSPNGSNSSRPSSRSGIITDENGRKFVPASIRSNGSARKEIGVRAGWVPPEDKEVWRSPTVLSMLPRNVRQNAAAHITNSKQRTIDGGLETTSTKDESGDVVMKEADQNDTAPPPTSEAHILAPTNPPPGGDDAKRRTQSVSSAMFATEGERSPSCGSPSRRSSSSKREMSRTPSSLPSEATTEIFKRMEKESKGCGHVRALGIKEANFHLGCIPK